MNFDIFDGIEFSEKTLLLQECKAVERNVYVEPFTSIASARNALEILCSELLKCRGIKVQKGADGNSRLFQEISTCLDHGLFQSGEAATLVRKNGNKVLHAKLDDSMHVVKQEHIRMAKEVTESLYVVMQQAFAKTEFAFDSDRIPFGSYEVMRKVRRSQTEVGVGECNYFIRNGQGECYYMQVYPIQSGVEREQLLVERNEDARGKIMGNKKRRLYLIESKMLQALPQGSDREYICYPVYEDSFLLSELREPMKQQQAVHVGLDLLSSLLEMRKLGIHHRNIQPGCVVLTPDDDEFQALLVNMETAKIEESDKTVYGSIKDYFLQNPYIPREVRSGNDETQKVDWEKVDVYSVAMVMLYCVNPMLVKENVDVDELYDVFSDELVEAFREVFDSSLPLIYSLQEFKEILENEIM